MNKTQQDPGKQHRTRALAYTAKTDQRAAKAPNSKAQAYANAYDDGLIHLSDIPPAIAGAVMRLVFGK